jgi:hypothetical protein
MVEKPPPSPQKITIKKFKKRVKIENNRPPASGNL